MGKSSLKDQFDRLPGRLLITDTDSKAVYANLAVEKSTGYVLGEIIGKKPGQLWGGKMDRDFYDRMWQILVEEKRPFSGKVENKKKNGTAYSDNLFIAPIKDENGVTRYYAQIHPEFQSESDEEIFRNEFENETMEQGKNGGLLRWMYEKLQKKEKGKENILEQADQSKDLVSIFSESFVQPIEKLFTRRYEDAALVQEAQRDVTKFSILYEKYYVLIREYFFRRLSNDVETAEDLTQEVFARALRYLPQFHLANASYYTYLLRIAHNLLVNYYRKHATASFSLTPSKMDDISDFFREPEMQSIKRLLGGLTEKEKSIC